jgi:type IV pilus assembly protein PilB
MKIEPYLLASSMSGIIAQRLVRKLCPECSVIEEPNATEKALFEKHNFVIPKVHRSRGCPSCNYKGFVGRVGIFEIMPVSHDVQELIAGDAKVSAVEQKAREEGMLTILEAGLQKVKEGITTIEEILKVASD